MSKIERLPDEVVLGVVAELRAVRDLKTLQLVSRRFHKLARDRSVWRSLCFESSIAGRRHNRATIPKTIPSRQVQALQAEVATVQSLKDDMVRTREQARAEGMAKWDPRYEEEPKVDWYREYVARQAPVNLQWATGTSKRVEEDVDGVGIYRDQQGSNFGFVRYEDRSVALWDLGSSTDQPGRVHRSRSGLLNGGFPTFYEGIAEDQAAISSSTISECISIDQDRARAYVAVDCQLNEVDPNTLQLTSCTTLPRSISALSNCSPGLPLVVGTSAGLYRHDPRQPTRWFDSDRAFAREQSPQNSSLGADPQLPLSIIQNTSSSDNSSEIYAAGRYPSILCYDHRNFPRVRHSIWSGATFSSLSLVPSLLPQIGDAPSAAPDLKDGIRSGAVRGHTLLAAGHKNGKGSLELYGVDGASGQIVGNIRNRTSASRVKLLSVAMHGRRLCASDADGNVKWFERDAFNLVRQVNTNDLAAAALASSLARKKSNNSLSSSTSHSPSASPPGSWGGSGGGIFGTRQDNSDVVQKLIPVGDKENADLLVWAGSRVGLLSTAREPREDEDADEELDEQTVKARRYESDMRRLLEAAAVETRRMQDFGT